MRLKTSFIIAAFFFGFPSADTLTFQQGLNGYTGCSDTYVVMSSDSTPDNASTLIVEGYHCSACIDQRTLIRFDLGSIDKNATITSAKLMLYSPRQPRPGEGTIRAFKIGKSWVPGEANWFNASQSVRWTKQGADFDTVTQATLTYSITVNTWHTLDVAKAIKDFIANPESNFGLLLKLDPAMYTVAYNSSENTKSDQRPKLIVVYTGASVRQSTDTARNSASFSILRSGNNLTLTVSDHDQNRVLLTRLNGESVFDERFTGPTFTIYTGSITPGMYGIMVNGKSRGDLLIH